MLARETEKFDIFFIELFINCIKSNPDPYTFLSKFEGLLPSGFAYSTERNQYVNSYDIQIEKNKIDQLKNNKNIDIFFIKEKENIANVNCTEYCDTSQVLELITETFDQYAKYQVEKLTKNYSNIEFNEPKLISDFLYSLIEISKYLRANKNCNFEKAYTAFEDIGNFIYYNFKAIYFNYPAFIDFNNYIQSLDKSDNKTKLAIRDYSWQKTTNLHSFLIEKGIINKDTTILSIHQFLKGKIPNPKIIWIKDARHLRYFINKYSQTNNLKKKCGQPFKACQLIFKLEKNELESKTWARNHNKLNDINEIQLLDQALSILS